MLVEVIHCFPFRVKGSLTTNLQCPLWPLKDYRSCKDLGKNVIKCCRFLTLNCQSCYMATAYFKSSSQEYKLC